MHGVHGQKVIGGQRSDRRFWRAGLDGFGIFREAKGVNMLPRRWRIGQIGETHPAEPSILGSNLGEGALLVQDFDFFAAAQLSEFLKSLGGLVDQNVCVVGAADRIAGGFGARRRCAGNENQKRKGSSLHPVPQVQRLRSGMPDSQEIS